MVPDKKEKCWRGEALLVLDRCISDVSRNFSEKPFTSQVPFVEGTVGRPLKEKVSKSVEKEGFVERVD